jgi:SulP family sulfate permease
MPVLAGLLIVVGFRTLKLEQVRMVGKTGWVQQTVMLLTFVAALFVPLQYAVLVGVGLAVLLFVFNQSNKITVRAWELGVGRYPVEGAPPTEVPARQVTVLVPYGSLFFAAAPVFDEQLPKVTTTSRHAVVIVVLRGKRDVGSTFLKVIARYADRLRQQESRLMLAGVDPYVKEQIERTGIMRHIGWENVFLVDERVGQALQDAMDAAEAWIAEQPADLLPSEGER